MTFKRRDEKTMGHPLSEALQWHIDQGVDVPVGDTPVNRTKSDVVAAPAPVAVAAASAPVASGSQAALHQAAMDAALACQTLDDLRAAIQAFDGLEIKRTATNLVFADGNPKARVMVIGEAPGTDEDRQGLPFVGESGHLLDRMFECIGLNRESLYISNILNWRPPGNRSPLDSEITLALPFIERHIALIAPAYIVAFGAVAGKALTNQDLSISRLRGRFYPYTPVTDGIAADLPAPAAPARIMTMYHPSYLLRTPLQKKKAWQDLLMLEAAMKG